MGALVACAALVLVAACGNSDSSSGSGGEGPAAAGTSEEAKTAAKGTTAAMETPTKISATVPLSGAPKKELMISVQCAEIPSCKANGDGVEAASKALGWDTKRITFQTADPSSLVDALRQALAFKPVAVTFCCVPEAVWKSVVADYRAAGVALIPQSVGPVELNDTVVANIGNPEDSVRMGATVADWVIADSDAGGHALVLNVPDFPILNAASEGFSAKIKSACKECESTTLDVTSAEAVGATGATPAVISALQRDSSIDYLIATNAAFLPGLTGALSAAGLDKRVRVAGTYGEENATAAIKRGEFSAFTGYPAVVVGWIIVDAAVRHSLGMEPDPSQLSIPFRLMTDENLEAPSASDDIPTDYQDQYKAVWGVS
jgi:ribose transport system substrate-binding protein